jgi:hypothetical protein
MATCRVCRGEYTSKKTCPRCGKEPLWETVDHSTLEFYSSPVILLSLLGIFGMACVIFGMLSTRESGRGLFDPIYVAVILLGVASIPAGLYQQRWSWWERQWAAEVYEVRPVSVKSLMIRLFVLALVTGLGFYVFFKLWGSTGRENEIIWWQKMIFGSMYVSMHISLMGALTLFQLGKVLEDLRNEVPQPIYLDTKKLQLLVQKESLQMLECVNRKGQAYKPKNYKNYGVAVMVEQKGQMEFRMTFGLSDGGGGITGSQGTSLVKMQDVVRREQSRQWEVVTDRWGRIQSLRPKSIVHVITSS